MTRSQTLAVTHGLNSYAQGLVSAAALIGLNGDLLHLTGEAIPVGSTNFEYAEFNADAGLRIIDTAISDSDPEGPTIDYGGVKRTGSLIENGASSVWYKTDGVSDADVINSVKSAARMGSNKMMLSRLNVGITNINATATVPTAIDSTNAATEVVKLLQDAVQAARLASGGFCDIHCLWGSAAFLAVANHAKVQGRVNGGATRTEPSTITLEQMDNLIGLNTKSRLSNAVYTSSKRGQTVANAFLLSNVVYIAAVSTTPDQMDPGAVKLFKGTGDPMSPIFWKHPSNTHERCKWNWQELIKVTNAAAIQKQVITV